MLALLLMGCNDLDWALHNNIPCAEVTTATCGDQPYWDQICTPCNARYEWDREYEYFPQTLEEDQTIRPIDLARVLDVDIERDDGAVLDAYFIPAHGEHLDNSEVTVLYNHGNYAGIEHYLPRVRYLHEAGFNLYVWDYRGYGKTTPDVAPDAPTWFADSRAARDAVDDVAPDPDKVLVYGNSLGALPAVEQVLYRPGCAMFFEAGFTSLEALAGSNSGVFLPDSMLSSGSYDNLEKIVSYRGPFFAMIGSEDGTFRVEDTQALVDRAGTLPEDKALWVLDGVDHGITTVGVPEASYGEYALQMDTFLDEREACR